MVPMRTPKSVILSEEDTEALVQPRPFANGYVPPHNKMGEWAYDDKLSVQDKLTRWVFFTMMRKRHIIWDVVAAELGVSHARTSQMFQKLDYGNNKIRIETAIRAITKRRHDEVCSCDDWDHQVYVVSHPSDDRMVQAQMGAIDQWRNRKF